MALLLKLKAECRKAKFSKSLTAFYAENCKKQWSKGPKREYFRFLLVHLASIFGPIWSYYSIMIHSVQSMDCAYYSFGHIIRLFGLLGLFSFSLTKHINIFTIRPNLTLFAFRPNLSDLCFWFTLNLTENLCSRYFCNFQIERFQTQIDNI